MCFFLSNNTRFLKNHYAENYNGIVSSIHNIDENVLPLVNSIPISSQLQDDDSYRICSSSSNITEVLDIKEFILWKTYLCISSPYDLSLIIKRFDWIAALNNIDSSQHQIAFILNDCDYYYVYRNETGKLFYNNALTFSTKPFIGSLLLPSNTVFMLDFRNKLLIDLKDK